MKKDAFYFPHFSNARTDSKILKLRRVMGIEGYGIYFMLLEVLREQTEYKLPIDSIEDLAFEFQISKEKISAVVTNFDLFVIDESHFFSSKLVFYLQPYIEKSQLARVAAQKRWLKANADANAMQMHMQMHSVGNASKVKESKVKESKVKESKYPDVAQVVEYFKENGYSQKAAERAYRYYNDAGWVDSHGKKVRNWKQKMQAVWFKDENLAIEEAKFISLNDLENAIKDIEQSQLINAR